jgi:hypothetical protein
MSDVPIFVSMPSKLNDHQQAVFDTLKKTMKQARLFPSTVGRSVLPLQSPLGEVYQLARRCAGGLILGFRQSLTSDVIRWPGTKFQKQDNEQVYHPSPWNQLEAGILYSLGVPMLILAEEGVTGGIFDRGVANHFIHEFNAEAFDEEATQRMGMLILDWSRHVINYYMEDNSRDWRR